MTMSQTYAHGWRGRSSPKCTMDIIVWRTILWQQLGAAIDMLNDALRACPDELWRDRLWDAPADRPEYAQFWYRVFHTLLWLDLYLSGAREGFAPPAPFKLNESGDGPLLPEEPYTKDELQAYLDYDRRKCQRTIEALTEAAAQQLCRFEWLELSFAELLLYNMRHVQEHASQLNMILGQKVGSAPDWVPQAR